MKKLLELIIVIFAIVIGPQIPNFVLASQISADEFQKSGAGAVVAGLVLGAYKIYSGKRNGDG